MRFISSAAAMLCVCCILMATIVASQSGDDEQTTQGAWTPPPPPPPSNGDPFYVAPKTLGRSFRLDWTSLSALQRVFTLDSATLRTDGSLSCARPGHVLVNQVIDFKSVRGGIVLMNNQNTDCNSKAEVSVGHLTSIDSYSYGDLSINMRMAHTPGTGDEPPLNAFTCVSIFTGSKAGAQHNEISLCWNPSDPKNLHYSYWLGMQVDSEKMHQKLIPISFDPSQSYHIYTSKWRKNGLQLLIDGQVVYTINKSNVPWEPMQIRIILRPLGSSAVPTVYLGDAQLSILSTSYVNAPSSSSFALGPVPAALTGSGSGSGSVSGSGSSSTSSNNSPVDESDQPTEQPTEQPTLAPTRLRRRRRSPTPRPQRRRRRPTPRPVRSRRRSRPTYQRNDDGAEQEQELEE